MYNLNRSESRNFHGRETVEGGVPAGEPRDITTKVRMETKSQYNSQFPPLNADRMKKSYADRVKGNKSNSGNLSNHEHQIYL